jgi:hypothetical protein
LQGFDDWPVADEEHGLGPHEGAGGHGRSHAAVRREHESAVSRVRAVRSEQAGWECKRLHSDLGCVLAQGLRV